MHPLPSRRGFLAGTGGLLAASLASSVAAEAAAAAETPEKRKPFNIVLVVADDLGWGQLGCYGQQKIKTPTLDRLAAEGVRFTDAYAGSSLCAPSRCALLTGLHAGHGTVRENPEGGPQHSLVDADLTFAEVARLAGYRTACFGKWGFGPERPGQVSHPNERGFDEFLGYLTHVHAHQYFPAYLWHNGRRLTLDGRTYAPDLFRDHAVDFIRRNAGHPFLLYFPSNLPHAPSQVPGDAGQYAHEPWTRANRRHAAQLTRLDSNVADLVRALHEAGVAEHTVLLFTADNGPHHEKGVNPAVFDSNGPFRGVKRQLYEGGIRVPMIGWSPSFTHRVVHDPVALWDILPTVADFAGVPAPSGLDGRSLRGLLTGSAYTGHEALLWNRPRKMQAIRRGHWKLIRFNPRIAGAGPDGRVELYDLRADRGERNDLSAQRPEIVAELLAALDAGIGPDPRQPYGLRLWEEEGTGDLGVTLLNGSAKTWRNVRIALGDAWKARYASKVDELQPGASFTVMFKARAPRVSASRVSASGGAASGGAASSGVRSGATRAHATARFSAGGRTVVFHARRP